jgi:uncharacterized membrane protein YkvA (DUF1232 family)
VSFSAIPEWAWTVFGLVIGVALLWLGLLLVLLIEQRKTGRETDWRGMARLLPDVVRLIKRLATDRTVPRATRWWLSALLVYLVIPIDLIPDFVPVIGYADDAIITAVALRFAIKHAGYATVRKNWPGTPDGLRTVLTLVRLRPADESHDDPAGG